MKIEYVPMLDLYETGNYVRSFGSEKELEEYLGSVWEGYLKSRNYSVIRSEHLKITV